jgi:two-component system nitrogen regulation response regulator NtrX
MDILKLYAWPGNVRELKNLVERLAIMVQNDTITTKDLPANLSDSKTAAGELFRIDGLDQARLAFEAEYVRKKLAAHDNDVGKTADAIGVTSEYIRSLVTDQKP